MEKHINETIEDRSFAKELCTDIKERGGKVMTDLLTFKQQMGKSEQIWSGEVGLLKEQLLL